MNEKDLENKYTDLSPEAKKLVARVIEIEKSKEHMGTPRGVNNEILKAVKQIIQ